MANPVSDKNIYDLEYNAFSKNNATSFAILCCKSFLAISSLWIASLQVENYTVIWPLSHSAKRYFAIKGDYLIESLTIFPFNGFDTKQTI